ncbi:MAG: FHA domain-containing protein [Deltaproteobacteria bacterium]|nr:FHA domain-containing protein [Deltaproteobacteria bacterium]
MSIEQPAAEHNTTTESSRDGGKCRLRVINGPLRDATYLLDATLSIGRAYDADLQIVDRAVSRRHAEIATDERGRHVLVDLDSSNGTLVEEIRIRRWILTPGTVFRIAGTELVYEQRPRDPICEESGVYAMHYSDPRTYRGTVEFQVAGMELGVEQEPTQVQDDAPVRRDWGVSAGADAEPLLGEERLEVLAAGADGKAYDGSLLADILDYRELRTRSLRRKGMGASDVETLRTLEERLRPRSEESVRSGGGPGRAYHRFCCRVPARLRFASGEERPVMVADVGVDGAKIFAPDLRVSPDVPVWLAIDFVSRERAQTVVFTSHAVHARGEEIGLSFVGAPGESRRHREPTTRTRVPCVNGSRERRTTRWSSGRSRRRNSAGRRGPTV